MRSAVTISLVEEARGGPFVFWHDLAAACRIAAELGFDAIELFAPSADAVDRGNLRRLLADHGLALAAVGTGAGRIREGLHLSLADAQKRAHAQDFIRTLIDLGGEFGAPAIIGSMQGRSGDGVDAETATKYLAEALQSLGEYATRHQAPLLVEPLNRYETNLLNTLAEGVAILESLSTSNIRLLADLFHMNIEESHMAAAIRMAGPHVGHVHFVDSNRRAAGFGHIDFVPIREALEQLGYDGYLSAEALPMPDSEGAARQTIKAFREYMVSPQVARDSRD
jgi:sugar phosphate isomerase/epimerase